MPDQREGTLATEPLVEEPAGVAGDGGQPEWGSDVVADLLRALGIEFVSVMPGSTFRGLQDSLVNYTGNRDPSLMLCTHENVAVGLARGICPRHRPVRWPLCCTTSWGC